MFSYLLPINVCHDKISVRSGIQKKTKGITGMDIYNVNFKCWPFRAKYLLFSFINTKQNIGLQLNELVRK